MFQWMKLTALLTFWFSAAAFANKGPDFTIFEVRRPIALSNDEKTLKDFYIYAGSESGIKSGVVYDVVRQVPLYDGYQNRSLGEITIKVAQVKVIYVDKNVAVARYHQEFSRENLPVLLENHILLGDLVDVASESKVALEQGPESEESSQSVQLVINSVDLSSKISSKIYNP
jgi:hypothetical protein